MRVGELRVRRGEEDVTGEREFEAAGDGRAIDGAQQVADELVAAGVTAILNFAPALVSVPPNISLRKVDLALELQILSFYQSQREPGAGRRDSA